MAIYDSRKKELVEAYGENGCMKPDSWFIATFNDLTGNKKLYSDDVSFMYRDGSNYCVPEEEEVKTTLIVREYSGINADILINGASIGKTNAFIEIEPGNYTAVISKTGYEDQQIALVVREGQTNEYKYVKLVKNGTTGGDEGPGEEEEPGSEYETPAAIGPVLTLTGNTRLPSPIKVGEYNWFGWEFKNTGDAVWKGKTGVKLKGDNGTEWKWEGDETKQQTIVAGETKYVWAYTKVDSVPPGIITIVALMTKMN